ncbi:M14 family zinc carboxypeptidase [Xanthovirga aplysinae]|uniref:M14 family zinc carboxypeptidase n=1 Tax=Xanthovirga aplysinae TaxID=2529853 RepID=UPI0012BD2DC2|nr:M14 family zinc carboxypeptidase [Xanthovirga aplysinae]MTI33310.1 hypothetical protein [Xanthovirga aplysinae]
MKNIFIFLGLILNLSPLLAQDKYLTKFEKSEGKKTVTYHEGMQYFQMLAQGFPMIQIKEMGPTDSGHPLHLILFDVEEDFDLDKSRQKGKTVLFINNGIHPGESDGIDASMLFLRNLALNKKKQKKWKDVIIAVVPFYNIGGALNRNSFTRANQNGPEAYGFRGNAQNLDLNRDFIKNDSKNARSFAKIYHFLDPDVYLETHVSNGADYQYVMTLLPTQQDKLGGVLGDFLEKEMLPEVYRTMKDKNFDTTPYVNVWGTRNTPDNGWIQFIDNPRYSTGYTTLFNTIGYMAETHMLKPYKDRVEATYALMETFAEFTAEKGNEIRELRAQQKQAVAQQQSFPLSWAVDSTQYSTLTFKGYEGGFKKSKVSGLPRLYYDRNKPYEKEVKFYDHYNATANVNKPKAYVIPQGWHKVIDRLKTNQVVMQQLERDTTVSLAVYHIKDYQTSRFVYEGHYPHSKVELKKENEKVRLLKGDYIVYTGQAADRYIVETLEPKAPDSFFNWNFFDAILQQKEHFSPYVFEDEAAYLLANNADLQKKLEAEKKRDTEFAKNAYAQLNFVYQHSPYYEEAHLRYPVFRLEK